MPGIRLNEEAAIILTNFSWPGNIRQLKNVAEQISVIEKSREVNASTIKKYLPKEIYGSNLPMVIEEKKKSEQFSERDILYKVLFEMKNDVTEMKRVIVDLINNNNLSNNEKTAIITRLNKAESIESNSDFESSEERVKFDNSFHSNVPSFNEPIQESIEIEESLSLEEREKELIQKALKKHQGRRKNAAKELGISERTLYRKIKEYEIFK
jgi:DNA-binding NtrC family response regulator